jgi:hypothetical protein
MIFGEVQYAVATNMHHHLFTWLRIVYRQAIFDL